MKKLLLSLLFSLYIVNGAKSCEWMTEQNFNKIEIGIDLLKHQDVVDWLDGFCAEITSETIVGTYLIQELRFTQPYAGRYASITLKNGVIVSKHQFNLIK